MPCELRCPGFKAPAVVTADGDDPDADADVDALAHHTRWIRRPRNDRDRRYHCRTCGAHYPYLVDIAKTPPERYTNTPDPVPKHPNDPHDYGN